MNANGVENWKAHAALAQRAAKERQESAKRAHKLLRAVDKVTNGSYSALGESNVAVEVRKRRSLLGD